jgi:CRP-like cAMP-binding protein
MSYLANLVKGCPLFHEIYDEEVEQIIQTCDVATFKKGEAIIRQGEESSDIAIILSGSASVVIRDKYNKEKVVSQINAGELFGELVLINETRRTADIVAKEETNILIISYNDFYSFFNDNPKVFALMVLNVTRMVTTRLKSANNIINNLSHELQEAKENSSKKAS